MEISCQPHAPAALYPGWNRGGYSVKGCVGPRRGLDALGAKKKICLVVNRIPSRPARTPVAIVTVPTGLHSGSCISSNLITQYDSDISKIS